MRFFTGDIIGGIFELISYAIVLCTVIPIHEYAHGYVAYKLGDSTAKQQGRLTLNPFTHFDLVGAMLLLFTGFGWAKPVPVNPHNFNRKVNMRTGMALTALAGPVANILLSMLIMIIYKLFNIIIILSGSGTMALQSILITIINTSVYLAVFNLLPIPPLDGSKIFGTILPDKYYWTMMKYERYVTLILFALIFTGILSRPLSYVSGFIIKGLDFLTGFVDVLVRAII